LNTLYIWASKTRHVLQKSLYYQGFSLYLCSMNWKESRFYSVITNTCPSCHKGKVFKYGSVFHPNKFDKMYDNCTACGHKYEKEHGFFYGAMYASYAITVAMSVATFVLTYLFYSLAPYWLYIINILIVLVVLAPLNFRLGRLLWINIFTGYDPKAIEKHQQKIHNHG